MQTVSCNFSQTVSPYDPTPCAAVSSCVTCSGIEPGRHLQPYEVKRPASLKGTEQSQGQFAFAREQTGSAQSGHSPVAEMAPAALAFLPFVNNEHFHCTNDSNADKATNRHSGNIQHATPEPYAN